VEGPALRWELLAVSSPPSTIGMGVSARGDNGMRLSRPVFSEPIALPAGPLVLRCDRIDFEPGGIAYQHTHPGPGIRRLLFGSLNIVGLDGDGKDYAPGGRWMEHADTPVLATASQTEPSAFVRVMVPPLGLIRIGCAGGLPSPTKHQTEMCIQSCITCITFIKVLFKGYMTTCVQRPMTMKPRLRERPGPRFCRRSGRASGP
jgi:hypothetical protein